MWASSAQPDGSAPTGFCTSWGSRHFRTIGLAAGSRTIAGVTPLSDGACVVLQRVVRVAAIGLETIDAWRDAPWSLAEQGRWITAVTRLGIEGLAVSAPTRRAATELSGVEGWIPEKP